MSFQRAAIPIARHSVGFVTRRPLTVALRSWRHPQSTAQSHSSSFIRISRSYSTESKEAKAYSFNDIKSHTSSPSPSRILIDVREPSEYSAGHIPTAHNVPISSQPDALFLPADEFEERFGFQKPKAEQEVVFYCKSGVRSRAAAKLAEQVGYGSIGNYAGSWMDWEKQGGEKA